MTEKARFVLSDAEFAWNKSEVTEDATELRVLWFATLGLLRAVGHVLDKVDGPSDAAVGIAVKEAWRRWHDDRLKYRLFHDFIDAERNILVKEYEQRYEESSGPILAGGYVFALDELLFVPLTHGPFAGEDVRDVAREAIEWWREELDAIDIRTSELRARTG